MVRIDRKIWGWLAVVWVWALVSCGDGSVSTPTSVPPTETPPPTAVPRAGDRRQVPLPDSTITVPVRYVPAGPFLMGSDKADAYADEKPLHEINVPAFWIDETEVTNAQYAAFVAAENYREPGSTAGPDNHPVTQVAWADAAAFCAWRNGRLPTEPQWEKAARGTADQRDYPWGNEWSCARANADDETAIDDLVVEGGPDCDGYAQLAPAGSFSPVGDSPYGVQDMSGNAWEWTASRYAEYPYRRGDGREVRPTSGETWMVARGGSWLGRMARFLRVPGRLRLTADNRDELVGFRCVMR